MATGSSSTLETTQCDSQTLLTTREKRRIDRAAASENGSKRIRTRGKTRGYKYEKNKTNKPYGEITDTMRRVVGENADEFICKCSNFVQEYCPLNSVTYGRMDETTKERMLDKIKEKFNLPALVDGEHVDKALHTQCRNLYKFWRYRIKEEHFFRRTKEEALAQVPKDVTPEVWAWLVEFWSSPKEMDKSRKARKSNSARKSKSANGSLSTARIFHNMLNAPPEVQTQRNTEDGEEVSETVETEPLYIRLYERTKRNKGTFDPVSQANYESLKELHKEQLEVNGKDNLTVKETYAMAFGTKCGYIPGLGYGARMPKSSKAAQVNTEMARVEILLQEKESLSNEVVNLRETVQEQGKKIEQITSEQEKFQLGVYTLLREKGISV